MSELFKIFLKQGIGAPPQPVVSPGEAVRRGQIIAAMDPARLSVDLHSSVTGTVGEVTESYISILGSGESEDDFLGIDRSGSAADILRKAGIVGLGGAGFPSYVKIGTKLSPQGYIICNASECEPVLEHNLHQIRENPKGLLEGMRIAMEATGAGKGIIGMKFKHRDEIRQLTGTLKTLGIRDIRVLPLRNVYPVGEERALLRDTINQLLETTQLPSEADAVVFNAETLYAIRDAVLDGKPLIDKYITVAGELNGLEPGAARVIRVPVGKNIGAMLDSFGGIRESMGEILLGGPYTGRRGSREDHLVKTLGGIIVTKPFQTIGKQPLGIIQCACGPLYDRLEQVAASMDGTIVGHEICKNAVENKGTYKCMNPGNCPGQAEKVLALKKLGAGHVLIGHCTDCTNTVMGSAPRLGMEVHHITDHVMETMDQPLIRFYDESLL